MHINGMTIAIIKKQPEESEYDFTVFPLSKDSDLFAPTIDSELKLFQDREQIIGILKNKYLKEQLSWAEHCSIDKVLYYHELYNYIYLPEALYFMNLNYKFWVCFVINSENSYEIWLEWVKIRKLCDFNANLGLVLELDFEFEDILDTWKIEPIKMVIIKKELFKNNKSNHPVLPKSYKTFIYDLMEFNIIIALDTNDNSYIKYINLLKQSKPFLSNSEKQNKQYRDVVQLPLQPLKDNLTGTTYRVFEDDTKKYLVYLEAMKWGINEFKDKECVVMIVGAGRGGLVEQLVKIKFNGVIYIVEKNVNACVTLRNRILLEEGWSNIILIEDDIKNVTNIKVDIMISELVGSFGDNELCPETLFSCQHVLQGISIPSSYSSYIEPIYAPKVWQECYLNNACEILYCCNLYKYTSLSNPLDCFTFNHPSYDKLSLFKQLEFVCVRDSLFNGFAGYFFLVLYKHITLSTVRTSKTDNVNSWFPAYLPLNQEYFVKKDEKIILNIWRRSNNMYVWYEWCVVSPFISKIHNTSGTYSHIGKCIS